VVDRGVFFIRKSKGRGGDKNREKQKCGRSMNLYYNPVEERKSRYLLKYVIKHIEASQ
jgi:hypothetical protein